MRSVLGARPGRLAAGAAPLLVGAIALLLARSVVLPGQGFWDTGEFQVVAPLFGTAHPTGYPTYVTLGWLASLTDTALFVAIKKGYFTDERIDVVTTGFRSGANMVVPLGTGELDVGAGSPSAGCLPGP